MGDLVEWYRKSEDQGEHPVVIAATFPLHTSPGGMVHAREYAATVLYPLFSHCKEKVERLSDQFTHTDALESASVTKQDNTVVSCRLSKNSRDWPRSALALSVTIRLRLVGLRGQGGKFFYFVITNTADSNRCAWRFTVADWPAAPLHEKDYMGQDLDVLKKLFNETLRAMMEELSKASPDS